MPSENYDFTPWDSEDDIHKFIQLTPLVAGALGRVGAQTAAKTVASQGIKGAAKTGIKGAGAAAAKTAGASAASEAVASVTPEPAATAPAVETPEPASTPAVETPETTKPSGGIGAKKTNVGMQLAQQMQAGAAQRKQAQEQRAIEMARRGSSVQTGEPMDIALRLLKYRQTTLSAYDPMQIESNIQPQNSNIFIAAKPGNQETSNEELSRLSDEMLAEIAALKQEHGEFGITSATGRAEWDTEPSFMLTNVPDSARQSINEIAERFGQETIGVSEKGQEGADFVTPQGDMGDHFTGMGFEDDPMYSTDFPTGQRLTFKSEPMDIALRLLKDDDETYYEKKKIFERLKNTKHGEDVDSSINTDWFGLGFPITPFHRMNDRQTKLLSQMVFFHGTDGQPNVHSYWREPFQEAGHEYASEILMGDGMEHIPDEAYDELIRYHQHYNDAVEALPGGPVPQQGDIGWDEQWALINPQPGDPPSPLTHPHVTAQQRMTTEYPHWGEDEDSFQEHYGIEHENRQFTPQMDDDTWRDSIETGEPMDIAYQLLKNWEGHTDMHAPSPRNFNEYFGIKDSWVSLPKEGMDARPQLYDEVASAMNTAYAGASGGSHAKYKNADDLQSEDAHARYDMIDNDEDPYVDAARVFSQQDQGFKVSLTAHDGQTAAKRAVVDHMTDHMEIPGHYAELSGSWPRILDKKGLQPIDDYDHIQELVNRPTRPTETGPGTYTRVIGDKEHEKQIFGSPMKEGADWTNDFMQQSTAASRDGKVLVLNDYNYPQGATQ